MEKQIEIDEKIQKILKENEPAKKKLPKDKKDILLQNLSKKYDTLYKKNFLHNTYFIKIFLGTVLTFSLLFFVGLNYLSIFDRDNTKNNNAMDMFDTNSKVMYCDNPDECGIEEGAKSIGGSSNNSTFGRPNNIITDNLEAESVDYPLEYYFWLLFKIILFLIILIFLIIFIKKNFTKKE